MAQGTHHNQIDYILVKKRFRSCIKTAGTRTFPGADIESDHEMVMMTFQTRLKKSRKPTQPSIRFDLEKLNVPTAMSAFQSTIGGRFAPLVTLVDEDADLDSVVTHFGVHYGKTHAFIVGSKHMTSANEGISATLKNIVLSQSAHKSIWA